MFWIFALYAGFASIFTFGKAALGISAPLFLVGSRMSLAGGILLAYYCIRTKKRLSFSSLQLYCLIALAFVNIYVTNALEFWALSSLSSTKTCFFYSLSPFIAALLSFFCFHERLTLRQWSGLLIGFIGFLPLLLLQESTDQWNQDLSQLIGIGWPEIAMLGAVLASVGGWILLKKAVNSHSVDPVVANGMSMLIGGLIALFHSFISEPWQPIPVTDIPAFLSLSLVIMLISNFFCYNLYGYLLKRFSATLLSFAGFMTPLFTAVYGSIFLGEVISIYFYISATIVFIGLVLFYQEELKQGISATPLRQKVA
jgi:drug/metabolite transporter (DMT)-like permease